MICRARLYTYEGFSEDIGDDVWVTCSGQLVLDTIYAYREGLINKLDMGEDEISYWNREGYKTLCDKASTGDKEAKERFAAFNSCKILVTRILEIENEDDIFGINEVLDCYAG